MIYKPTLQLWFSVKWSHMLYIFYEIMADSSCFYKAALQTNACFVLYLAWVKRLLEVFRCSIIKDSIIIFSSAKGDEGC